MTRIMKQIHEVSSAVTDEVLQPSFMISVFIGVSLIILFEIIFRRYRTFINQRLPRFTCWFCHTYNDKNTPNSKPKDQLSVAALDDLWYCKECGQFNRFSKRGDYDAYLPELTDETYNARPKVKGEQCKSLLTTSGSVLCHTCNENQEKLVTELANYKPRSIRQNNKDTELEEYKDFLEKRYRLCPSCEISVKRELDLRNKQLNQYYYQKVLERSKHETLNLRIVEKVRLHPITLLRTLISDSVAALGIHVSYSVMQSRDVNLLRPSLSTLQTFLPSLVIGLMIIELLVVIVNTLQDPFATMRLGSFVKRMTCLSCILFLYLPSLMLGFGVPLNHDLPIFQYIFSTKVWGITSILLYLTYMWLASYEVLTFLAQIRHIKSKGSKSATDRNHTEESNIHETNTQYSHSLVENHTEEQNQTEVHSTPLISSILDHFSSLSLSSQTPTYAPPPALGIQEVDILDTHPAVHTSPTKRLHDMSNITLSRSPTQYIASYLFSRDTIVSRPVQHPPRVSRHKPIIPQVDTHHEASSVQYIPSYLFQGRE